MPRRRQRLAIVLAAIASLTVGLGPATAAETPTTGSDSTTSPSPGSTVASTASTASTPNRAPLMIVLDASGSMGLDENGEPGYGQRMSQAKSAIRSVLSSLPSDTEVGLTVFGSQTSNNTADEKIGCADVATLEPLAPIGSDAFDQSLDVVEPSGYAPIGLALQQAADSLGASGPRNILLISDANQYCESPEPCSVAQRLAASDGLAISTIGIMPDTAGKEVLDCIAKAARGRFLNTDDEADGDRDALVSVLTRGFQRTAEPYRPTGIPVVGTPEITSTPTVLTPGLYLDTSLTRGSFSDLGTTREGTVRYYELPQGTNMTPWVTARIIGDVRQTESAQLGLRVSLLSSDGDACVDPVDQTASTGPFSPAPRVTAVIGGIPPGSEGWSASCAANPPVFLRIERLGNYRSGTALPVEILVRSEPPAQTTGIPESEQSALTPPNPTTPTPLAGATNFTDAPLLTSGATVSDTIVAGEVRLFRIPVQWGQRLTYRVVATGVPTPVDATKVVADVTLYNPLRTLVAMNADRQNSQFTLPSNVFDDGPGGMTGDMAVSANYANRSSDDAAIAATAFAGDYYLAVRLGADTDAARYTVPYTVTVMVVGTAEAGPTYGRGVGSGATRVLGTTSAGPTTSASTPPVAAANSEPTGQTPSWVWALGGAAAALIVASIIALTLGRRRRRQVAATAKG